MERGAAITGELLRFDGVSTSVYEKEREKERKKERERERKKERKRER